MRPKPREYMTSEEYRRYLKDVLIRAIGDKDALAIAEYFRLLEEAHEY